MRIACVGEALIDFTATGAALGFQGHPGGALANAAVAAARLGQPTGFISQLSTDLFGEGLLAHLQANGVDTRFVLRSDASTALAFVERTPTTNRYAFHVEGTADAGWAPAELPRLPGDCVWLHFGSIALLREPAASRILDFAEAQRGRCLRLFDPNARPALIAGEAARWRRLCARAVAGCDLLKLSEEDLALLSPDLPAEAAAQHYLAQGAQAVVLTRGAEAVTLYRANAEPLSLRPPAVAVRDTVGAGDTFAAGLSVALLEHGVHTRAALAALPDKQWTAVLHFAANAAALSCTREGADPPLRAQVEALLRP